MRRNKYFYWGLSFLMLISKNAISQYYSISGVVKDAESGELLSAASIYELNTQKGTITDPSGYYFLSFSQKDSLHLQYSYLGYETQDTILYLSNKQTINIALNSGLSLEVVEVRATQRDNHLSNLPIDVATLSIPAIKTLPTLAGEQDPLKSMQLLPGIQGGAEGTSGLLVRGGTPDQNLFLLDDAPVYYPTHIGGFLSIVDANSIKNISILKGGFPSENGGKISSVIDVELKDGHKNRHLQSLALSPISSKLLLEGPLIKDKASYVISGRRSFLDLFSPLFQANQDFEFGFVIYDVYSKLNFIPSSRDRLTFSFYTGNDHLYLKAKDEVEFSDEITFFTAHEQIQWGNKVGSMKWQHQFSERLKMEWINSYSNYRYRLTSDVLTEDSVDRLRSYFRSGNSINDYSSQLKFKYYNNKNIIKFGTQFNFLQTTPRHFEALRTENNTPTLKENQKTVFQAQNLAAYAEYGFSLFDQQLKVNTGLRTTAYFLPQKVFITPQARLSFRYFLHPFFQLMASFAQAQQTTHFISTSGAGLPTDFWLPATFNLPPQRGFISAIGGQFQPFHQQNITLEASVFYKKMKNLIALKEGISVFQDATQWENRVYGKGKGEVWGIELLLKAQFGRFNTWLAYTLSKNTRSFVALNQGKPYDFKYGRRHDLSAVLNYSFNKKVSFSCSWVFNSGHFLTLATTHYPIVTLGVDESTHPDRAGIFPIGAHYYGGRNRYQSPAYHRLDFSFNFTKEKRKGVRTWKLGLYNAYNRANPYFIYFAKDSNNNNILKGITIFPLLPSITFEWKCL